MRAPLTRRRLLAAGLTAFGGCLDATATGPRNPPTAEGRPPEAETSTPTPSATQRVVEAVNRVFRAVRTPLLQADPTAYDAASRETVRGALADAETALTADSGGLDALVGLHREFAALLDSLSTVLTTVRESSPARVRARSVEAVLAPARDGVASLGSSLARLDTLAADVEAYPPAAYLDADTVAAVAETYRALRPPLDDLLDATATRLAGHVEWYRAAGAAGDAVVDALESARERYASARADLTVLESSLPETFAELASYGACLADAGVAACERALDAAANGTWEGGSPHAAATCSFDP